jgi:AAA ATPase-like protein
MQLEAEPHYLDFSSYIDQRSKHFAGREWVFRKLQNWLETPARGRYFLLTGAPGSGKTSISARLAACSLASAAPPSDCPALSPGFLAAIHFCRATEARWCDPLTFTGSIGWQLSQRFPDYAAALEKSVVPHIQLQVDLKAQRIEPHGVMAGVLLSGLELTSEQAFGRYFREPIEALVKARPDFRATILVDAIDEALAFSSRGSGIPDLIARIDQLTPNIRFILTTRDSTAIETLFSGERLDLSAANHVSANEADLDLYISSRLASTSGADQIRGALIAARNFLYVRFAVDLIEKQGPEAFRPGELPAEMDSLIAEWLRRTISIHGKDWLADYAPVLGALLAAKADLTLEQLKRFSQLPESRLRSNLLDLAFLLQSQDSGYAFYHQLLNEYLGKEWLCSGDRRVRNMHYIPAVEHHDRIVKAYKKGTNRWAEMAWARVDEYGLLYLSSHLAQVGMAAKDGGAIYEFICRELMTAKRARFGSDASFLSDVRLAIETAKTQAPPDCDQLIRCYLLIATLTSLSANASTFVVAALAWVGEIERALAIAAMRRNPHDFLHCAAALLSNGDRSAAREVVDRAINAALAIEDIDAIGGAVKLLYAMGEIEQAGGTALDAICSQHLGRDWERAFQTLADACVEAGHLRPMVKAIATYKSNRSYQGLLLSILADSLFQAGKREAARKTIDRALRAAQRYPHLEQHRCNIALTLARMGQSEAALKIARLIKSLPDCEAHVLAETGSLDEAFSRARQHPGGRLFDYALGAALRRGELDRVIEELRQHKADAGHWWQVVQAASRLERWEEALAAIPKTRRMAWRLDVWAPLAEALATANRESRKRGLAAIQAAEREISRAEPDIVPAIMAYTYARNGDREKAIQLATVSINLSRFHFNREELVDPLCEIALCLARHRRSEAAEVIRDVEMLAQDRALHASLRKRIRSTCEEVSRLLTGIIPTENATDPDEPIPAHEPVRIEELRQLVSEGRTFELQTIGEIAVADLGANAVLTVLAGIVNEYDRASTLERITFDLTARRSWRDALQFSLARIEFEAETAKRRRTFQDLARDVPVYWAIDNGPTLLNIRQIMLHLESWWN